MFISIIVYLNFQKMEFDLEQYRTQRLHREKRRKEFINRFEVIRTKLTARQQLHSQTDPLQLRGHSLSVPQKPSPLPHQSPQRHQHNPSSASPSPSQQKAAQSPPPAPSSHKQSDLSTQNLQLRKQLQKAEEISSQKMAELKKEILVLKETYLKEMEQITVLSQKEKAEAQKKMQTLIVQIKQAQTKNVEIEATNKALKEQASSSSGLLQNYLAEIEKEYKEKIGEFEQILKDSAEKIADMEKSFNEEELVDNALKNQKLMQSVLESGKEVKGSKDEYDSILKSKTQIVEELMENGRQKETEIKHIKQLTDKFRTMFQTLNSEKKQLMEDNVSMTNELLQIKNLFAQALGQDGGDQDDDEEEEDDNEGEEQEKAEAAAESN